MTRDEGKPQRTSSDPFSSSPIMEPSIGPICTRFACVVAASAFLASLFTTGRRHKRPAEAATG